MQYCSYTHQTTKTRFISKTGHNFNEQETMTCTEMKLVPMHDTCTKITATIKNARGEYMKKAREIVLHNNE